MKQRFLPVLRLLPAAALALALNSCSNDDAGYNNGDSLADSTATAQNDTTPKELPAGVPSPAEMFAFMKAANKANADINLLNPAENVDKYNSKKAQSLNLGIYSADLLYCSTFGGKGKVSPYFITCAKMGTKLNVATKMSESDRDRISKNLDNADSLIAISSDLYLTSFDDLNNSERGADLSLMLAGGWVESVYLMSNMVKDFDKDKATAENLADQKLSLGNLIEFMSKYNSNEDVKAVIGQLTELKGMFDAVQTSSGGSMQMKNGKRVLGGGSKTTITKEQFEKIKTKIAEIRNGYISAQ
jgi:hypothetical protein